MYCNKCGFKYEGNFCPICGAKAKKINLPPQDNTLNNRSVNANQNKNSYEYMYNNYKYNPQREIPQSLAEAVANTRKQKSKLREKNKATQNQPVAPLNSLNSTNKKDTHKPVIKKQADVIKQAPVIQKKKAQATPQPPVMPNTQQSTPQNAVVFKKQVNSNTQPSHIPTTRTVDTHTPALHNQSFAKQTETANRVYETATSSVAQQKKQRQPLKLWQIIIIVVVAVFSCSLITTVLPVGLYSCAYFMEDDVYDEPEFENELPKAKEIEIGDILKDECNVAYSITDVSKVAEYESFTPEEGYEFISVTLLITNNDKYTNYPSQEISVYADDIKCNLINSGRYNPYSEELYKGKSMSIKYVFEVPENATDKTLYLSYYYDSIAKLELE